MTSSEGYAETVATVLRWERVTRACKDGPAARTSRVAFSAASSLSEPGPAPTATSGQSSRAVLPSVMEQTLMEEVNTKLPVPSHRARAAVTWRGQ